MMCALSIVVAIALGVLLGFIVGSVYQVARLLEKDLDEVQRIVEEYQDSRESK